MSRSNFLTVVREYLTFVICYIRSHWSSIVAAPPDAILGLTEAFLKDENPQKVNLGVGAYRDDSGKPFLLKAVKEAERCVYDSQSNKEYLPIAGLAEFCQHAAKLAFGEDSPVIQEHRGCCFLRAVHNISKLISNIVHLKIC